jgi:hypothetical protein
MMRTTLNLPEDVYETARGLAAQKDISLGDAVAELVRKGFESPVNVDTRKAFPCFRVRPKASTIPEAVSTTEAMELLARITQLPEHGFWPDDLTLQQATAGLPPLISHRQGSARAARCKHQGSGTDRRLNPDTSAMRAGDFTGQPVIYDPATTAPNASGSGYVRTPFAGNRIPSARMDPVSMNILQAGFPEANLPGTANNHFNSGSARNPVNTHHESERITGRRLKAQPAEKRRTAGRGKEPAALV